MEQQQNIPVIRKKEIKVYGHDFKVLVIYSYVVSGRGAHWDLLHHDGAAAIVQVTAEEELTGASV